MRQHLRVVKESSSAGQAATVGQPTGTEVVCLFVWLTVYELLLVRVPTRIFRRCGDRVGPLLNSNLTCQDSSDCALASEVLSQNI